MAFYGFKEDLDDYYLTPYNTNGNYSYYSFSTQIQTPTEYDHPNEYYSSYNAPSSLHATNFKISYSKMEFNEPEFEEYDPTPYSGGYDPVKTYGKPFPPSEITCYPRSSPESEKNGFENFSYASIPSPYVDKKPTTNGIKPVESKTESFGNDDVAENGKTGNCDDGFEVGEYGYLDDVARMPYGSGLEGVDICESLFGYWPCLAKRAREQKCEKCCHCHDRERRMDPWESAADYLFGSPLVYDYESYPLQQQSQGNSWLHYNDN
ncbi:pro-resilin [Striga asiatica]|uniref:Pro-resilin n=1 Tax=Striga asiatica TaxID=4170 RepID=A0A5A7R5F0_STRAF|nr:pro-resilin [Striga asiatica]